MKLTVTLLALSLATPLCAQQASTPMPASERPQIAGTPAFDLSGVPECRRAGILHLISFGPRYFDAVRAAIEAAKRPNWTGADPCAVADD